MEVLGPVQGQDSYLFSVSIYFPLYFRKNYWLDIIFNLACKFSVFLGISAGRNELC